MDQTMLKCAGREFSETEIELVKEIVRMYPHLSRSELAATICENIGWTNHAGKSKERRQCGEFLDRLSDEGVINLSRRGNTDLRVCLKWKLRWKKYPRASPHCLLRYCRLKARDEAMAELYR
jgi:hypothetical protein